MRTARAGAVPEEAGGHDDTRTPQASKATAMRRATAAQRSLQHCKTADARNLKDVARVDGTEDMVGTKRMSKPETEVGGQEVVS